MMRVFLFVILALAGVTQSDAQISGGGGGQCYRIISTNPLRIVRCRRQLLEAPEGDEMNFEIDDELYFDAVDEEKILDLLHI